MTDEGADIMRWEISEPASADTLETSCGEEAEPVHRNAEVGPQ